MPKQAKILKGTFRKYRDDRPHLAPPLIRAVPKPPRGMTSWARARWKILAAELVEQDLLTTLDLGTLEICCGIYGIYAEARQAVYNPLDPATGKRRRRSLAEYLEGRSSQTSPELATMRAAERGYRQYLAEFGLSPSSRQRLTPPKSKDSGEDPMEALLRDP